MTVWGRVCSALGVAVATLGCVAATAHAASPADWMYEPTTFTEVHLTLPPASYALLEDAEYDDYVEGTFELAETDGVPGRAGPFSEPLSVGIKLKGGLGSRRSINEKAGLKVKFDEYVDDQTFYGLKKLTLNNMVQDPTMTHEVLAYRAFDRMDVFAPGVGFAYVWVNGKSYGLHLNLETPDKIALGKRFPPFQNPPQHLYEGEFGADLSTAINPKTGNPRWEDFEVDEGKNANRSDLTTLLAAVEGSGGSFSERVAPYADLAQMTRMWMTERYIGHWDGYSGFLAGHFLPNNYYLYSDPSGSFQMFPWGTDQTWSEHSDFATPSVGALFTGCLSDSSCAALYRQAGGKALGALTAPSFDTAARCTANDVQPWREYEVSASEPSRLPPYDLEETADWQTWSREFISERPAELAGYLGVAPPSGGTEPGPCPPLRPIGGFHPPPEPPPPVPPPPAGETAEPGAQQQQPVAPPPTALRISRRQVRGGAISLTASGSVGWLVLRGSFGPPERRGLACRGSGELSGSGEATVRCRFTAAFKRRLDAGRASLRLTASLTPASGAPASSTKTIRVPQS